MASATNPQSVFNVFVYGSLLADDVVRALLKRVPPSSPAILHNFHRFSITGCVYPAILPVENKKVNGKVCLTFSTYCPMELVMYVGTYFVIPASCSRYAKSLDYLLKVTSKHLSYSAIMLT